ncbi:MAG: DUF2997 domain-containing protein [Planctomycetota bacterium]|nr:DUF2997 domain-containing protein [Planctomycetota bacterium]
MSNKEELEIKIGEDGQVTVEVIGGDGSSCLRVTKDIEEALGKVADRQLKTEFYSGGAGDNEVYVGES